MRLASLAFWRKIAPVDSERVYPQAFSSNGRQVPLLLSTPKRKKFNVVYGWSIRLQPATMAVSHWPFFMALKAQSKAYNELLHAESRQKDGPWSPKQYDNRLANIARLHLQTESPTSRFTTKSINSFNAYPAKLNPSVYTFSKQRVFSVSE